MMCVKDYLQTGHASKVLSSCFHCAAQSGHKHKCPQGTKVNCTWCSIHITQQSIAMLPIRQKYAAFGALVEAMSWQRLYSRSVDSLSLSQPG
jgi:hypothetical protein